MRLLGTFRRDRRASLTVEFALIAPVLILLYFGCTEIYVSLTVARKVQVVTGAVNDIVSRSSTISNTELSKVFDLAKVAMVPFSASPIKIKTTAIYVDDSGNAKVEWSCGDAGSGASSAGDKATLPASLSALRKAQIVTTQTGYAYVPFSGYVFNRSIDLGGVSYADPRYSDKVTSTGC